MRSLIYDDCIHVIFCFKATPNCSKFLTMYTNKIYSLFCGSNINLAIIQHICVGLRSCRCYQVMVCISMGNYGEFYYWSKVNWILLQFVRFRAIPVNTKHDPMSFKCLSGVYVAGMALIQRWVNVPSFLGCPLRSRDQHSHGTTNDTTEDNLVTRSHDSWAGPMRVIVPGDTPLPSWNETLANRWLDVVPAPQTLAKFLTSSGPMFWCLLGYSVGDLEFSNHSRVIQQVHR